MKTKYFAAVLLLLICNYTEAQVPVIKEPHHNPVLVNDYVRLLDVHINAGDTTLYHIHATPSVIINLSNSNVGIQKKGEAASAPANSTTGNVSYVDFGTNPVTHRVFNAGNNIYHVMDIEIVPKQASTDSFDVLKQSNFKTIVNEKSVRAYKFDVSADQSLTINKSRQAYLLVCADGEISAANKTIKAGDYIFFKPGINLPLINKSNSNASCVLLQLK